MSLAQLQPALTTSNRVKFPGRDVYPELKLLSDKVLDPMGSWVICKTGSFKVQWKKNKGRGEEC